MSTLANNPNVIICKDFIQAALDRKYRKFFQVIDRGNIDMGMVEQALQGKAEAIGTANCIVTVVMGDLETSSNTVTLNGKGNKIKNILYKQPYTGKIRDLSGNVLLAFDGLAEHRITQNNVVKTELSDPRRELMQKACAKIADEIGLYFTKEIKFAVKGPKGDDKFDADDVTVTIDGNEVNIDAPIYAIACEHEIQATVSGYKKIQRVISLSEGGEDARVVKLNFKKLDAKAAED